MLELPPAPAARVLEGLWLAAAAARSAAFLRLIMFLGPPGTALGEEARTFSLPEAVPVGESARGEDCMVLEAALVMSERTGDVVSQGSVELEVRHTISAVRGFDSKGGVLALGRRCWRTDLV